MAVAIIHILVFSAIYLNSNESSECISVCNGGIFLKIHSIHWSHTLHKIYKYGCDRQVTNNIYMKKI